MHPFDHILDTWETERLKTLALWSQIPDHDLDHRPEPRARTPREHMIHQCQSEDGWLKGMLGIDVGLPVLPDSTERRPFLEHYALASERRLTALRARGPSWFLEEVDFFEARRTRAWVLVRRLTHNAHHRGQLQALLRQRGEALYSTYGPTADTGGLPRSGAGVVYRYADVEALLADRDGEQRPPLPGPGPEPVTERGEPLRP
ncbi:MAG: DinB family protein [Planctomycetota bacterium]